MQTSLGYQWYFSEEHTSERQFCRRMKPVWKLRQRNKMVLAEQVAQNVYSREQKNSFSSFA